MSYQNILFEKKDRIAYITLNRPNVMNAIDLEMLDELGQAIADASKDSDVGVVIITGSGERAFSAGADINLLSVLSPIECKGFADKACYVYDRIENLGKPVVAAINGLALGGGCELAEACAVRIASEDARLGHPEINIGSISGWGGTTRLPRLIGKGRAMGLLLTGRMIDAKEACEMGLVNQVVPKSQLMDTAQKFADEVLSKSPLAIRLTIEAVNSGLNTNIKESCAIGANYFGLAASTEDMKEGTRAFLEKRKPNFKGF